MKEKTTKSEQTEPENHGEEHDMHHEGSENKNCCGDCKGGSSCTRIKEELITTINNNPV